MQKIEKKQKLKTGKLNELMKNGGRKGASEDFYELLKRSVKFRKLIKK